METVRTELRTRAKIAAIAKSPVVLKTMFGCLPVDSQFSAIKIFGGCFMDADTKKAFDQVQV